MQRRSLLKLGLASSVLLAAVGTGAALWAPGLHGSQLTSSGRQIFRAIATAVLEGMLPAANSERDRALDAHLDRVAATVAALSPAARAELSQLLGVLATMPGRRWLAGLDQAWNHASATELERTLQDMRLAHSALRQQAYHALRDLTNAAYVSVPEGWRHLGYPGPAEL
jgi:hypothetical protein